MQIRDRIKELRRVRASELRRNPHNWRKHPEAQQSALLTVLEEIGFVGALLARETEDGSLLLIDGHLRAELAPDAEVPVLVLDVTQTEADLILATFDQLSKLAETDREALAELFKQLDGQTNELAELLEQLGQNEGVMLPDFEPATIADQGKLDEKAKITCPECGHAFTP